MNVSEKQGKYHHGNLRNALIVAAAELIKENGSYDFALAEAARKAGVSSAAPYRHFRDKEALLQAVAELAFLALTEKTHRVAASHTPGSRECIVALGKAYIIFVRQHPEFYDLMWGEHGKRARTEETELKTSGFFVFVDMVQKWCEVEGPRDADAVELAVKIWAMAHGLAGLAMNRNIDIFLTGADVYSLLESSTNTILDGLRRESGQNTLGA